MTAETYRIAVDAACNAARGAGPMWNQLFVAALNDRGLCLLPTSFPLPQQYHMQAPFPFSAGEPRWPDCWIVEIEHMTAAFAQERRQQGLDA